MRYHLFLIALVGSIYKQSFQPIYEKHWLGKSSQDCVILDWNINKQNQNVNVYSWYMKSNDHSARIIPLDA